MTNRTRDEMIEIINRGESVFVRDRDGGLRIASRVDQIPGDADLALASNDPARKAAAREALLDRKRAIDLELAAIESSPAPAAGPAGPEGPAPDAPRAEADPLPLPEPEKPRVFGKGK